MAKYAKLGHIVRISQILRAWRKKATFLSDVPSGHVVMCVGSNCRRFVVRTAYLNHPIFRQLLSEAEEEYGFCYQSGPLAIPCDELVFEEILRFMSRSESGLKRSCRWSMIRNQYFGSIHPGLFRYNGATQPRPAAG
ncbi:auxin-induced protein X15-like [Primulina huaijiensis]|uniref:auxin-induced protein X15-like n=1 Tax=Primulina huaijiensis TaxID=1492673 RepID=UPI003CC7060A